jgi:hypothetical protein
MTCAPKHLRSYATVPFGSARLRVWCRRPGRVSSQAPLPHSPRDIHSVQGSPPALTLALPDAVQAEICLLHGVREVGQDFPHGKRTFAWCVDPQAPAPGTAASPPTWILGQCSQRCTAPSTWCHPRPSPRARLCPGPMSLIGPIGSIRPSPILFPPAPRAAPQNPCQAGR